MKSNYILAKYDVSGIQDYIFTTNRLREIAGASYQVTRILEEYLVEALQEIAHVHQIKVVTDWEGQKVLLPDKEQVKAEIIYIGGGNAVVLFREIELFCQVGEILGKRLAAECQGIYLVTAYIQTGLDNFSEDWKALAQKMTAVKQNMIRQPLYSPFPVVEQEPLNHQPLTHRPEEAGTQEWLTREQFQKREAYQKIKDCQRMSPKLDWPYQYPEEMEALARCHGEDSQVALVHIDGNGMGERIRILLEEQSDYAAGITVIRRESKAIAMLFANTYQEILRKLGQDLEFEERKENRFPLRPILLDGDDFTFLCRAELAVPLVTGFMMKLMESQQQEQRKITACGGIVFMHSHFPFRVAYTIAEESCARAKQKWYANKCQKEKQERLCYLDFQVIKESEAELPGQECKWQQRPYVITLEPDKQNQDSLWRLHDTLAKMAAWPSGRLHKIYQTMQGEASGMELLEREFTSRGYQISELALGKWQNSPLFDALELQGMCRCDLLKKFLDKQ